MIGLIVTGQGKFATGLENALTKISGKPDYFFALDFEEGQTAVQLEARIDAALDKLQDCDATLILTDYAGGIPFKSSVEVGYPRGAQVVAGTNLGMLVEMNACRQYYSDNDQLAKQALTVGKDQVQRFVYNPSKTPLRKLRHKNS